MDKQCSVGKFLQSTCNGREKRKNINIDSEDISLNDVELIKIRLGIQEIEDICLQRKKYLINDFPGRFCQCADPLKNHKTKVRTNLHEIKMSEYINFSN